MIFFQFLFILVIYILLFLFFKKHYRIPSNVFLLFFCFHTLMAIAFWAFSLNSTADALLYYSGIKGAVVAPFGVGTTFIYFLMYFFVNYFGFNYFLCYLVFNLFGIIGIFYAYLSIREYISDNLKFKKYLNLCLFIPGISFWTAAIGKDSIIFLAIGFLMYAVSDLKKRWLFFVIALGVSLAVRPHMFIIILVAFILSLYFSRPKIGKYQKWLIFLVLIAVVIKLGTFVMSYVGLRNLLFLKQYILYRLSLNQGGSSFANSNPIVLVFSFLFRPLFFDAKNLMMFLASFENLLYLWIGIQLISMGFLKYLKNVKSFYIRFNLIFFLIGSAVFSFTNKNLGIAVRMKVMFIFSFLAIFLIYQYYLFKKKAAKKKILCAE